MFSRYVPMRGRRAAAAAVVADGGGPSGSGWPQTPWPHSIRPLAGPVGTRVMARVGRDSPGAFRRTPDGRRPLGTRIRPLFQRPPSPARGPRCPKGVDRPLSWLSLDRARRTLGYYSGGRGVRPTPRSRGRHVCFTAGVVFHGKRSGYAEVLDDLRGGAVSDARCPLPGRPKQGRKGPIMGLLRRLRHPSP